ncbi:NAD(P)H-dependent oxidoreductase [Dyadobacter flavalbus]|uniref:NAD(P)H-dependent oxidoreductase n=1 Tax=Dyadobacter flavalbus TaxID=2579942 RepID=A0A5M8QXP5_9BACT|nr:NAD(P)H-dependent oxidoreductase [Dyadobacter flavalbus]KAA6439193.1 NAD(P)H-dependent oxidoreductase [Dyadobacter flavalbus]
MNNLVILGISGSLRADSSNTMILKTIQRLLPEAITFRIFEGMDQIPHFSPRIPENEAVARFKNAVRQANGIIISTPEYAFGVPGTLKNALDWTVSTGDFNEKPVCAISASPLDSGGRNALASLLLILTALGTKKHENASLSIAHIKSKLDPEINLVTHPETLIALQDQVNNLLKYIGFTFG